MKSKQRNMLSGPLLPSIISFAIPVILTGVLQLLFNAADLVVVGQHCGSISVAAVGATGSLTILMVNFFMGFSIGTGANMANAIGGRDEELMHRIVHTALSVALSCGAVLTVVGVAFSGTFLIWMGTPEDVLPLSTVYMRIYFGGALFNMIYNFAASILRAAGDTRSPMIFLGLAGVVNVLMNLLFVTVFGMDVEGVALATTISQAISAVLTVWALTKRIDACRLQFRKLRFYKAPLLKIIAQGLPAGIQSSLFSISNVLIQSSVNSFGDVFMSGNAAAANLDGFVYVSMNAFYQTSINYVGQNAGAGQYKRVKRILWTCFACATVVGMAVAGGIYLFAKPLLALYITDSPQAISYGILRLTYVGLPYFLCGMMEVTTGVLRGMQASLLPMIISVLGVCGVRIGWILTIFQSEQFHTPEGLYVSYPVSWIFTMLVQLAACLWIYRKRVKAYQRQNILPEDGT